MSRVLGMPIDLDDERGRSVLAALGYRRCDVVEVRVSQRTIFVDVITGHPSIGVRLVRIDRYETHESQGRRRVDDHSPGK